MVDYTPLWQTLEKKGMTQYTLLMKGLDRHTLDSLRNNRGITTHTIEHLCKILDCTPNDILRFTSDK